MMRLDGVFLFCVCACVCACVCVCVFLSPPPLPSPSSRLLLQMWLCQTSATHFAVDFSDSLVFSKIDTIQYSVMADAAVFTPSFAHTPTNTTAIIEFQQPVTATVVVQVAQGLYHCC